MLAVQLFVFQIGQLMFEWGAVRKKNADFVIMRHLIVFCLATICIFVIGFDLAYGESSEGKRHLFSMNFIQKEAEAYNLMKNTASECTHDNKVVLNQLGANYLILIIQASITSNIAMSSISERQTLSVQLVFALVVSTLLVPLLTGWTFGQGFLQVLYMEDQGGCLSLHLASGMAAMMACYIMKERTGRYDPISIKRNFEDEDQHIFLSTNQI